MGTPRFRLGIAAAINGTAIVALGATLLEDGADLQVAASRAYLALMLLLVPIAIFVVLSLPPAHRRAALHCVLIGAVAMLLIGGLELPSDAPMAPSMGLLARY